MLCFYLILFSGDILLNPSFTTTKKQPSPVKKSFAPSAREKEEEEEEEEEGE